MSVNLANLEADYEKMGRQIDSMRKELKERCPHPDEFVKKLESYPVRPGKAQRITLSYCGLCRSTMNTKGI
jgi:hypothetical protein